MIEVLFAESEAESMRAAKSSVVRRKPDGPTAGLLGGKRRPAGEEAEKAKKANKAEKADEAENADKGAWIEGTSREVLCLRYLLDIGDISKDIESPYRKNLIASLCEQGEPGQEVDRFQQMEQLKAYLEAGESIRIWYSSAPYSRCGFYHLCQVLSPYENRVLAVPLPEYVVNGKSIVCYKNWGEVAAEGFSRFLTGARELARAEIRYYAALWSLLKAENSPLRAMVNGRIISVPEDFYDFMIFDRLSEQPVKEARLIGAILSGTQANIGDWWYASRIQYYIGEGKIKVLEDAEQPYGRWICRG